MRKLIALVGLAVLGVGGYFVVDQYSVLIPQKLERAATDALRKANIVGVAVAMDGLDATLSGAVPTADQREVAATVVARVAGIRGVDAQAISISAPDRGPGEPVAEPALDLQATWDGSLLDLKGQVLGAVLDQRIVQKVAQAFEGAGVTRNLDVRPGASERQDELIKRAVAGLEALGMTVRGTLRVTETGVTLNGTVADDGTRERMTQLLKSSVSPQGELALSVVVDPQSAPVVEADGGPTGEPDVVGGEEEDGVVFVSLDDDDAGLVEEDVMPMPAQVDAEAKVAETADAAPVTADAAAPGVAGDTAEPTPSGDAVAANDAATGGDDTAGAATAGGPPHGVVLSATTPLGEDVCEDVLWWLVEGEKHIQFDRKKAIAAESEATVAQVAKVLLRCGDGKVMIEGYTDAYGEPDELRAMSYRWALNVKKRLVELGVPEARLLVKSYGYNRPRYPDRAATRQLNRRIEFKLKGVK